MHCFLIFALKHKLWVLVRTASVPTIYILSKNKKIIKFFHLKIIFFTTLKNCCELHGHVFVMLLLIPVLVSFSSIVNERVPMVLNKVKEAE